MKRMVEFDCDAAVKTAAEFKKLLNEAQSILRMCDEEINEADKAFGDIRHYCELKYTSDRKKRSDVYKLIREYSIRRRRAKDIKSLLEPLGLWSATNVTARENLFKTINVMQKELNYINGDKKYAPRVLDELFKEEEENGKTGSQKS